MALRELGLVDGHLELLVKISTLVGVVVRRPFEQRLFAGKQVFEGYDVGRALGQGMDGRESRATRRRLRVPEHPG